MNRREITRFHGIVRNVVAQRLSNIPNNQTTANLMTALVYRNALRHPSCESKGPRN